MMRPEARSRSGTCSRVKGHVTRHGASSSSRTTRTSWAGVSKSPARSRTPRRPRRRRQARSGRPRRPRPPRAHRARSGRERALPPPRRPPRAVPDVFEIHQETFWGLAYQGDAPAAPGDDRLGAFSQVPAGAGGAHPQGPAPAVGRDHVTDHHRIGGLHALVRDLHGDPFAQLDRGGLCDRPDRPYSASLAADDLAHVILSHPELQVHARVGLGTRDLYLVGSSTSERARTSTSSSSCPTPRP